MKNFKKIGGVRANYRNIIDMNEGANTNQLLYYNSGTFSFDNGFEITFSGTNFNNIDSGYTIVGGTGQFFSIGGKVQFGTPPGDNCI